MAVCKKCGGHLAKINGRTLKEALALTKAAFHIKKFSSTHWVSVCPYCDAYVLGAETIHRWPFQASDGVMRIIDDYDRGHVAVESETLEFFGFKFSEGAIRSANRLLGVEDESTRAIEVQGASLSNNASYEDFLQFSRDVCEWGRGQRVWGNLLRHHGSEKLSRLLKSWLVNVGSSCEYEEAIARGANIKGLGVSFASKHLRMLNPERYAVLDSVFQQGLGIALNPRGYCLFMSTLRTLGDQLKPPLKIANLEAAVFLLIRQDVRAKADNY